MAEKSELNEYIENVTRCSICLEDLTNPKSLPCLHTFCLSCVEGHCGDKQPEDDLQCPVCRSVFKIPRDGPASLQHNFFLDQLTELKNVSQRQLLERVWCEACEDENTDATMYCVDCRQQLCERCSIPHRKIRTAPHKVVPLNQDLQAEVLTSRGAQCRRHVEEREKLYCFNCMDNICLMCFAVEHQQHKCQEIAIAAESFRHQLATVGDKISAQISSVRQLMALTEVTRSEFLNEVKKLQKVIEQRGEEVKRAVDNCVKTAIQQLELVKMDSMKIIDSEKDRFQLSLVALESFYAYSLELQNKGKSEDVSRAAKDLFRRAKELIQNDTQTTVYKAPHITVTPVHCEIQDCVANLVGSVVINKLTGAILIHCLKSFIIL